MTREEAKKILMIIQTSYPNWHPADLSFTVDTWTIMFEGYEYAEVSTALKTYILADTSGFAPSIGQLVDKIHSLRERTGEGKALGELEAWSLVYKAICNSNYHAEEEFAKLPPVVQRAVGSPENLKEWAQMDTDTVQSVEQSHFVRGYRLALEQEQQDAKLPQEVKAMLKQRAAALLENGG